MTLGTPRLLVALLAALALSLGVVPAASATDVSAGHGTADVGSDEWVGTWSAAPQPPYPTGISAEGFRDQTLRMIVHTSIGGPQVRVRLSNAFGDRPVRFGDVRVGIRARGSAIVPGTNRPVTFSGSRRVVVPRGAEVISDPVALAVEADQDLAVSMYVPDATGPATWHALPRSTNYISARDNRTGRTSGSGFTRRSTSWFFVSGVDVVAPQAAGAVVALGDSITDGFASTVDAERTWPDVLSDRLRADGGLPLGVLNQGISGNRVLNDSQCCGVNALARLDRDVLAQPGVETLVVLEGINDIGFSELDLPALAPNTAVSAGEIIAGYEQIIRRAHGRGLRVIGGTLTPFEGARYFTAEGERKRDAVNDWIRTSGAFDGVIDFDAAVRDPADPDRLLPAYDSGDHLHPSDAGYAAMAEAVDLDLLREPMDQQELDDAA